MLQGVATTFVRHFSRKCRQNLRKINPKVPPQEASSIAHDLYQLIKERGPLTVPNAWIQAQEAGVNGLSSKTHMKIMLKWMRGRKMLKQFCTHVGSSKKFLLSTLPEEPGTVIPENFSTITLETQKPELKRKKRKT